jgi:uncharacterized protein YhdP
LVATIDVQPERVQMEAAEARLCGIAFPFTFQLTRQGMVGSAQIRAKGQQLEATARCLSDQHTLLTGEFDLRADLRTAGNRGDLVRNLEGSVEFHARRGKVKKWGLLGNILALKSISHLFTKGGTRLDETGFDYREILMRGRVTAGRLVVEEAAFDSSALGLAGKGSVRLEDRGADLMVLVAPFSRVDRLVRKVPIVGYVLGGTLTSFPVGVSGDIRDPQVVPLSPTAVTSELAGIFERTFKLPGKLFAPLQEGTKPAEGTR